MADEETLSSNAKALTDDVAVPPKKKRAPRRTKAAMAEAAAAAAPSVVKQRKPRGKNAKRSTEATVRTPILVVDELAELLQLEEDNKRLRKALASKLRTENADLRKRLGMD